MTLTFHQIDDQRSGEPFEVTISVRDGSGLVTSANGSLALSASTGQVTVEDPRGVVLRNGTWSGRVVLEVCADRMTLRASGLQGMANNSGEFSVTGCEEPAKGMLWLFAIDRERVPQAGANYALWHCPRTPEDVNPIHQGIVSENGLAVVGDLVPGRYTISANIEKDGRSFSGETTVTIEERLIAVKNVIVRSSRKPLLLVPGIMGSTMVPIEEQICRRNLATCVVPSLLPEVDRSDLHPLDPSLLLKGRAVGIVSFEERFSEDFEIFRVPWDWRMDVKEAWKEFLKPAIEDAKKATGHDSVDIVAHSMGGLLVREYMQQPEELYEDDVDRFVMVGTPNEGSSNTYIMEEGGDPRLVDDIQGYFMALLAVPFYTSALRMDMQNRNGQVEEAPVDIRRYLKNHVPTLNQLSPVYPFLMTDSEFDPGRTQLYEAKCSPNSYLKGANLDLPLLYENRFPNNKTRLFVSTPEQTIFLIRVKEIPEECDPDVLYGSGEYMEVRRGTPGDGTVLARAAAYPFERLHGGNNDIVVMGDFGGHAGMLGNERLQRAIFAFLLPDRPFPAERVQSFTQDLGTQKSAQAEERRLSISIRGDVQPLVVNPAGKSVGIEPGTLELMKEFGQSSLTTFRGGAHLSIVNIDPQRYLVRLHGRSGSDFTVYITWIDGDTGLEESVTGHHEGGVTEFEIDLGAVDGHDVIIHPLEAPTGITAREEQGATVISWSAVGDPLVTGYRIYGRPPGWPDFRRIGSATATEFVTEHPWNDRQDQVDWIYMVISEAADGSVSFYEGTALNRTPAFLIRNRAGDIIDGRYFLANPGQPFHFTLGGGSGLFDVAATVNGQPLSGAIEDQGNGAFTFIAEGTLVARITVTDTRTGVRSWFTIDVQPIGSLSITIEPEEARLAGAQWRLTDGDEWRDSGETESDLPVGTHTVEFKDVDGWTTPDNLAVTVEGYETATATGTYTVPADPIPTLSQWGTIILTILLLTLGWVCLARIRDNGNLAA